MNKITLRKFYDTSGNYKAVRCKTFEEAKKFWEASKKINHLVNIKNEEQLEKIYYDKQNTKATFCFSDEDWWADDEWYKNREIYSFNDIIIKEPDLIDDKLYNILQDKDLDLDLTISEIELIIKTIKKNFNMKIKRGK